MADLLRRVGKMLAMRPMTIIPLRRGASAIYNRISTHVPDELNRADLGANRDLTAQRVHKI